MVVVASSAAFLDSDSPQFLFANLRDRKCLLPADHAFEAFNLTGFSYAFLGSWDRSGVEHASRLRHLDEFVWGNRLQQLGLDSPGARQNDMHGKLQDMIGCVSVPSLARVFLGLWRAETGLRMAEILVKPAAGPTPGVWRGGRWLGRCALIHVIDMTYQFLSIHIQFYFLILLSETWLNSCMRLVVSIGQYIYIYIRIYI